MTNNLPDCQVCGRPGHLVYVFLPSYDIRVVCTAHQAAFAYAQLNVDYKVFEVFQDLDVAKRWIEQKKKGARA